ncbi:MAG: hypothetical protein WCL50_09020 [Spirochaetota bacterium]
MRIDPGHDLLDGPDAAPHGRAGGAVGLGPGRAGQDAGHLDEGGGHRELGSGTRGRALPAESGEFPPDGTGGVLDGGEAVRVGIEEPGGAPPGPRFPPVEAAEGKDRAEKGKWVAVETEDQDPRPAMDLSRARLVNERSPPSRTAIRLSPRLPPKEQASKPVRTSARSSPSGKGAGRPSSTSASSRANRSEASGPEGENRCIIIRCRFDGKPEGGGTANRIAQESCGSGTQ